MITLTKIGFSKQSFFSLPVPLLESTAHWLLLLFIQNKKSLLAVLNNLDLMPKYKAMKTPHFKSHEKYELCATCKERM